MKRAMEFRLKHEQLEKRRKLYPKKNEEVYKNRFKGDHRKKKEPQLA